MVRPRSRAFITFLVGTTALITTATTLAATSQADGASPPNASGCNGSVCISIEGSGTYVDDWQTTAWAATALCTEADFWANGVLKRQSSSQCVGAGTELESDWKNTSFPNGTVLCNTWSGIPGEPCETIES